MPVLRCSPFPSCSIPCRLEHNQHRNRMEINSGTGFIVANKILFYETILQTTIVYNNNNISPRLVTGHYYMAWRWSLPGSYCASSRRRRLTVTEILLCNLSEIVSRFPELSPINSFVQSRPRQSSCSKLNLNPPPNTLQISRNPTGCRDDNSQRISSLVRVFVGEDNYVEILRNLRVIN